MTKLLVEQLFSGVELTQPFKFHLDTRSLIAGFYPYIYMQGAPAGDFTVGFRKLNGSLFFERLFTSEDIKEILNTTHNHAHVFLPCVPEFPLMLEKGDYEAFLSAENYSYNRGSFLGWVKQHENLNNELDYSPSNDAENPLAFRMKVYKEGIL